MSEEVKKSAKPVGRGEDAASTGEATSESLQETTSVRQQGDAAASGDAAPEDAASQASQKSQSSQKPDEAAGSAPAPASEPDWKDLYARLRADFDNFKKRTARDREDTYRYAESDILGDILPTVDNLALALANATVDADVSSASNKADPAASDTDKQSASTAFVTGVQLVYDTLMKSLKDHGAEPFDSVGQALDTERMEAIATLPSDTVAEGLVSNEVKRGWMLKGKVLRVAQVVVSSGKSQ